MNHCADVSGAGVAKFPRRILSSLILASLIGPLAGTAWSQTPGEAPTTATSASPRQGPPPTQPTATVGQAQAGTTEFRLSNGLRVIVKEDHRAPTVAHMIFYRVGGFDEVSGTTGVAHMLEHMMFKGTPKVPVGEFSRQIALLGGRENALTNRDFTLYYQQISKQYLPKMMELEADRMANLIFKKEEFEREMKVVMEERRLRTDDSPRGTVYEQLLATVYTAMPYRHPVIGWMDDLVNMRVEEIGRAHV